MPIPKENLNRLDAAIDNHLRKRDSEYRNTDPVEFLETPEIRRNLPIAEPVMPQDDSARTKRDLFK
jgi:hypothetical protein